MSWTCVENHTQDIVDLFVCLFVGPILDDIPGAHSSHFRARVCVYVCLCVCLCLCLCVCLSVRGLQSTPFDL